MQNSSATIMTCGMESYNNNPCLLQELVENLPPSIRLNWAMHKQTISIVNIIRRISFQRLSEVVGNPSFVFLIVAALDHYTLVLTSLT